MLKMKLCAAILILSATSCATNGPVQVIDTSCYWVQPIWMDAGEIDHMTDGTLRQILTHNETWKKKCSGDKMPASKG